MKQLFDIHSDYAFYLLIGFLLLIPFSIAGCYILFSLILIQLIVSSVKRMRTPKEEREKGKPFLKLPSYFKYFMLFILFTFISSLFSIDWQNSLKDNKEFFVFLLIPVFLIVINSPKRLNWTLIAVLAASVGSALFGFGEAFFFKGVTTQARIHGAVSHWMTYAGLLMFSFVFYFVYLFYERRSKFKWGTGILLLIILVPILLSLTRSVWVGIFLSLGLFIVYYKPKILYIAVPALVLLVVFLPPSVKSRVTSIFDLSNETNRDRIYMVQTAFNIFKEHPLTGVGPNSIEKVYNDYKPAEAKLTNPHLHNNFLHILAERGIFTLLAFIAAFVSLILHLIKRIKIGKDFEKVIATGSLFVVFGFLVAGLFEYNFGDTEIKFLLFYFISIPFLTFDFSAAPVFSSPTAPAGSVSSEGDPDD